MHFVFLRLAAAEATLRPGESGRMAVAKGLECDPIGATQTAFRALTQGERREFLRWCQDFQEARKRKREPVSPVEKDFAATLAKMDFAEPG